jgi:hypothetical protein
LSFIKSPPKRISNAVISHICKKVNNYRWKCKQFFYKQNLIKMLTSP